MAEGSPQEAVKDRKQTAVGRMQKKLKVFFPATAYWFLITDH